MKFNFLLKKDGQAITEALVALSVLTIGFVSIVAFINRSVNSVGLAADKNIAAGLASEGIEIVKSVVEYERNNGRFHTNFSGAVFEIDYLNGPGDVPKNDWTKAAPGNRKPLNIDGNGFYSYEPGEPTKFFRIVDIANANANEITAISTVSWTKSGNVTEEVVVESHFYNY